MEKLVIVAISLRPNLLTESLASREISCDENLHINDVMNDVDI